MTRKGSWRLAGLVLLTAALTSAAAAQTVERYTAELHPLNAAAIGRPASGTATFSIENGQLTITILANGLAPGVMHLQHYHGFPEGKDATCPSPEADTNGDGFVDLVETEPMAGTTMVPFHADPASLEVASDSYPIANEQGTIRYRETVPVDALEQALKEKFGTSELALDKRVVFLHGTAPDAGLPSSVQSLPEVPAQVTLPIACGTIERTQ